MKKIEAIIREDCFEDVRTALNEVDITGLTVYQVMGCGNQKGWQEVVRGKQVEMHLLPKIKLEIVVSTPAWAEKAIDAIINAANTGTQGDGKIFVSDLEEVIRIRTKERGIDAL